MTDPLRISHQWPLLKGSKADIAPVEQEFIRPGSPPAAPWLPLSLYASDRHRTVHGNTTLRRYTNGEYAHLGAAEGYLHAVNNEEWESQDPDYPARRVKRHGDGIKAHDDSVDSDIRVIEQDYEDFIHRRSGISYLVWLAEPTITDSDGNVWPGIDGQNGHVSYMTGGGASTEQVSNTHWLQLHFLLGNSHLIAGRPYFLYQGPFFWWGLRNRIFSQRSTYRDYLASSLSVRTDMGSRGDVQGQTDLWAAVHATGGSMLFPMYTLNTDDWTADDMETVYANVFWAADDVGVPISMALEVSEWDNTNLATGGDTKRARYERYLRQANARRRQVGGNIFLTGWGAAPSEEAIQATVDILSEAP